MIPFLVELTEKGLGLSSNYSVNLKAPTLLRRLAA